MTPTNESVSVIEQATKAITPLIVGGTDVVLIYLVIALHGVAAKLEALNQRLYDLTYSVEHVEENRSH
jgi:hypothetical protein